LLITSKITDQTRPTHDDAKVEFSKYNINVLQVVKFIFKKVKSSKHDMHEEYESL